MILKIKTAFCANNSKSAKRVEIPEGWKVNKDIDQELAWMFISGKKLKTYALTVAVAGVLQRNGYLCDHDELRSLINKHTKDYYDQQDLAELHPEPTLENITSVIFINLSRIIIDKSYALHSVELAVPEDNIAFEIGGHSNPVKVHFLGDYHPNAYNQQTEARNEPA